MGKNKSHRAHDKPPDNNKKRKSNKRSAKIKRSRRKFGECTRKVAYGNIGLARAALKRMNDPTLHTYHCRYYDHWHLGHIKPFLI